MIGSYAKNQFPPTIGHDPDSRATDCSLYSGENRRLVCFVISSLQVGIQFTAWSGIREQRHYTGVKRSKRLVVLVGHKKVVAIAVCNVSERRRWSKLNEWPGETEVCGVVAGLRSLSVADPGSALASGVRP